MENFFHAETFHSDLDSLLSDMDIHSVEDLDRLDDEWTIRIEMTDREPMFQLSSKQMLEDLCDNHTERFSEDGSEDKEILIALNECIDFEKLNSMIPKMYYPNNVFKLLDKHILNMHIRG